MNQTIVESVIWTLVLFGGRNQMVVESVIWTSVVFGGCKVDLIIWSSFTLVDTQVCILYRHIKDYK